MLKNKGEKMKTLNKEEIAEVMSSGSGVVYFGAPWCKDCKFAKPILEELKKSYQNVNFYDVNVDDSEGVRDEYSIRHIPTIFYLKDGKEMHERVVEPHSKNTIEEGIKKII